jgi:transcriptional regulator with XRE-family HTH domain
MESEIMEQNIVEYIGEMIRYHRKSQNITLSTLSEKSGLTVNYISMIEKGQANASINKIDALVKALNIYWKDIIPKS